MIRKFLCPKCGAVTGKFYAVVLENTEYTVTFDENGDTDWVYNSHTTVKQEYIVCPVCNAKMVNVSPRDLAVEVDNNGVIRLVGNYWRTPAGQRALDTIANTRGLRFQ